MGQSQTSHLKPHTSNSGFTLIELLVVLSIMALIAGSVIASYAGQRPNRNLHIAENELVTNIRKVQSYTLSSRTLPNGQAPQFYILRFDTANPAQYLIQGVYNVTNPPGVVLNTETINLPQGTKITNLSVQVGNAVTNTSCVLVGYALPYGKIINSSSCSGGPPTITGSPTPDDYYNLVNLVSGTNGNASQNSLVVIGLDDTGATIPVHRVLINGITQVICPTADGLTCASSY